MSLGSSPAGQIRGAVRDAASTSVLTVFFVVSAVVAGLWIVMSLTYPFGWDQGIFAWAGGVIVRGGLPYQDAWDLKGPLVYYVYALAQALFGVHLWSIRVFDVALLIAATIALFRTASALTDRFVARWAATLFFCWYASHSYWHTAQPDGWAGMLMIIALGPLLARMPVGVERWIVVGICFGAIALCKPVLAVFVLLPIVDIALSGTPRRPRRLAALIGGWLVPVAVAVCWFAWRGALDELIAVHIRYSATYAGLSPGDRLRGLVDYVLAGRLIAVMLPIVLYGAVELWTSRRPAAVLLIGWAALGLGSVLLQNRFYAYHWLPMLPAATLLASVGLYRVRQHLPGFASLAGAVFLLHTLAPIVLEEARFVSWVTGRIDRDAYYDAYGEPGNDMKAVRWLRNDGRDGRIFVFGWNSAIAWLSDRQMVSRFGFSMPLLIGEGLETRARYRAELLAALRATPPRYLVVGTQSDRIIGATMTLDDFPELALLVSNSYREVQRFGRIVIYENMH